MQSADVALPTSMADDTAAAAATTKKKSTLSFVRAASVLVGLILIVTAVASLVVLFQNLCNAVNRSLWRHLVIVQVVHC